MAQIGFIGLGNMGLPMARNLIKAGHPVCGYDVNAAALDKFSAAGGISVRSLDVASMGVDLVITMLPAREQVREVYLAPGGVLASAKPGTLLKHHIPIRTGNRDVTRPGFIEADTVAHCGNSLAGDFVWSLVFTDIFSGWTQLRAIWNKGAAGIQEQIADLEKQTPFALAGFDCDNGSEFLNYPLLEYFTRRKNPVAFTRSRPYHKNDNAHVEQKNWTHVRQLPGWDRLENRQLVSKERVRSRYRKRYDPPQTPCERLLQSREVSPGNKLQLQAAYTRLNPFALKKTIEQKLKKMFALNRVQQGESMNP